MWPTLAVPPNFAQLSLPRLWVCFESCANNAKFFKKLMQGKFICAFFHCLAWITAFAGIKTASRILQLASSTFNKRKNWQNFTDRFSGIGVPASVWCQHYRLSAPTAESVRTYLNRLSSNFIKYIHTVTPWAYVTPQWSHTMPSKLISVEICITQARLLSRPKENFQITAEPLRFFNPLQQCTPQQKAQYFCLMQLYNLKGLKISKC